MVHDQYYGKVDIVPSKMRSHLSVVSIFSASFAILLWSGEAAGFCATVFENQQGKYIGFKSCSPRNDAYVGGSTKIFWLLSQT